MEIAFYIIQTFIALLGVCVTLWPPEKTDKRKKLIYLILFLGLGVIGGAIAWKQTRYNDRDKTELQRRLTELKSQSEKTDTAVQSLTGSPLKVEIVSPKNQPSKSTSPCVYPTKFISSQVTIPRMGTGYLTEVRIANPKGITPIARFNIYINGEVHSISADESLAGKNIGISWPSTPGRSGAPVDHGIYHVSVQSEIPKRLPLTVLFMSEFQPLHVVCVDRFPDLPPPK